MMQISGWKHHVVPLFNGQYDTNIKTKENYATYTLGDIWSATPAKKPKADAPAFIPSCYHDYNARNHQVQRECGAFVALTGDIDKDNVPLDRVRHLTHTLFGDATAVFVHSTGSASADNKRWRIIVPLDKPVSFDQWSLHQKAFFGFMETNGVPMDRALARPAQPVYLPNVPPDKRGEDGKPLYYDGYKAGQEGLTMTTLTPDFSDAIKTLRADMQTKEDVRAAAARGPVRTFSGDGPIATYNGSHHIKALLTHYKYEVAPDGKNWRSPHQQSGSYATGFFVGEDNNEFWISLSDSDAAAGLGMQTANGHRSGDAFDLFTHYEHGGDRNTALSAWNNTPTEVEAEHRKEQREINKKIGSGSDIVPKTETSSVCPQSQPDWSLKGDLIASRFFKDLLGEQMKFVVSIGKWLRWDTNDSQWRWCELGEEVEATKQLVLELRRRAHLHAADHPETGAKLTNEVSGLQREPRIRAVINLAKSEPGISMEPQELDAHPELLGVRNGAVNLRTGRLRPNEPVLYITKYVDIEYHESATCPLFKSFLHEIFQNDGDTIDSVHRLAGLTMTGCADEEVIVFCVGTGANGKSIFGNIMTSIMGAHAVTAPPSLLAARRSDDHGPRSDLAMLHGARLVSINELPGGMMLDETVAKQLAGREPISARFLHKEFFTFKPQFTPWVRTNHRPIIKGTDNGIWRRIAIVPFLRTFSPNEQDHGLEKKLRTEKEGVLAWLVEGAKLYLRSGLKHSHSMKAGLNQYRDDSDLLGEFLADYTISEPDAEVEQSSLFVDYKLWCERNQLRPVSKRILTEQLRERGFGQRKSGSERYYLGLKLTSAPFRGGCFGQVGQV